MAANIEDGLHFVLNRVIEVRVCVLKSGYVFQHFSVLIRVWFPTLSGSPTPKF